MPEKFLDEIDSVATSENRTRSELIREALRSYMYKSRVKAGTMATKNAAILEALLD
jgi:metal-responsive CopG/Arc/MetJ family transcriptional regulator